MMKTETTTTATFSDKGEAIAFATKALLKGDSIRVWFSDHYWNEADRYEVIVVTIDSKPGVGTWDTFTCIE